MSIFNPLRHLNKPIEDDAIFNFNVTPELVYSYKNALPFPHIVIDNFIKDTHVVDDVINEFKQYVYWGHDPSEYSKNHQVNKFFSPWCKDNIKDLPNATKKIIDQLNSTQMLRKLESLTSINNLIADHDLSGGGMHKIERDGKLSVHVDYNKHPLKPIYRRINLLLYLNKDWQESWGGDLQFWNKDMNSIGQSIQPIYNRVVIFNTTSSSYHGHPYPLKCPEGVSRYSIAMYYFTKENVETENNTSAIWKQIPQ